MSAPDKSLKRTADQLETAWVADEDRFVLEQTKKKSLIRIKANRAQTIDWLTVTLIITNSEHNKLDDEIDTAELELKDPMDVIYAKSAEDLQAMVKEIETFITLETSASNRKFWEAIKESCEDQIEAIKPTKKEYRDITNVSEQINTIFAKKDYDDLVKLEAQVKEKIAKGGMLDPDFWNGILERMKGAKSKAKLKQISENLHKVHKGTFAEKGKGEMTTSSRFVTAGGGAYTYNRGGLTVPKSSSDSNSSLMPAAKKARTDAGENKSTATDDLIARERARGMGEGEEMFAAEATVTMSNSQARSQAAWATQHRPRKPKYFNRVAMGFEWNKYNQTHYDQDNPPPKIVQGYKFNIFYPDLLDVMKTPTFKIEREHGRRKGESSAPAGEDDTCIIRFIGGPPYEDIAFRIVDKDWDYSTKSDRGFKSVFDKGVLQLHFQFKRVWNPNARPGFSSKRGY